MKRKRRNSLFITPLFLGIVLSASSAKGEAKTDVAQEIDIKERIEIEHSILENLRRTQSIRSQAILVDLHDGILTLSGQADNLADARSAVEIASLNSGVEAVINQIVVQPPFIDDETLTNNAVETAAALPAVDSSKMQIRAIDGRLELTGKVDSLAEKRILESELSFLRGVASIDNQLEVQSTTDQSDAELQAIIAQLIENSAILDRSKISVEVEGPVVRLSGIVATPGQKRFAITTAEIPGITQVDAAKLEIRQDGREDERQAQRLRAVSDATIQKSIEKAWKFHPLVAAVSTDLVAVANRGNVVLSGSVKNHSIKTAAREIAATVTGVAGITNKIQVDWSEENHTDPEIVQDVRRAILRDAYLEYADIIPRSRNAHVHLYGMVDTKFEKERAARIASAQPGVVHVANYLTISNTDAELTDFEIKEEIDQKLALMNSVAGVEVRVSVTNGVPVFRGSVTTWFEWQSLLRIAKEAGARKPHLDVSILMKPASAGTELYVPN